MPHTIRKLKGEFKEGPSVLLERPSLAVLITLIAAKYTEIENQIGYSFALMLSGEGGAALAIYLDFFDRGPRERIEGVRAA